MFCGLPSNVGMHGGITNTGHAVVIVYVWQFMALDNNKKKFGSISVSYGCS